jgi:hypothetical protein
MLQLMWAWLTPDKIIAIATVVYAGVTIVMFRAISSQAKAAHRQADIADRAAKAAQDSADVAQKSLVLTQRPRIVVRAFYFSETKGVGGIYYVPNRAEAGSFCQGQFYIVNSGGTRGRLQEVYCEVFIDKRLPMKRPYEGEIGIQQEIILLPGQSIPFLFGRSQPLEADVAGKISTGENSLYVLGRIGYVDDLGIYTDVPFCRRYDPAKDRFVLIEDPDYESGD